MITNIEKRGIYIRTPEIKLKQREAMKGRLHSKIHNKRISEGGKGRIQTELTRKKISEANKISCNTEEHKRLAAELRRGNKSHLWKGGISSLGILIRNMYEMTTWRNLVFKRDDYTCQKCHKRGLFIIAHHKVSLSFIIYKFLKKYFQFNPVKDKYHLLQLAIIYKPFWRVENGITLCKSCHDNFHSIYGIIKNTILQINEFIYE